MDSPEDAIRLAVVIQKAREIAQWQRRLLFSVIAQLLGFSLILGGVAIGFSFESLDYFRVFVIGGMPFLYAPIFGVVGLAKSLGVPPAGRAFWILIGLLPGINLHFLPELYGNALAALRESGVKVGLLGISDSNLLRQFGLAACLRCGQKSAGFVNTICPECGTLFR